MDVKILPVNVNSSRKCICKICSLTKNVILFVHINNKTLYFVTLFSLVILLYKKTCNRRWLLYYPA